MEKIKKYIPKIILLDTMLYTLIIVTLYFILSSFKLMFREWIYIVSAVIIIGGFVAGIIQLLSKIKEKVLRNVLIGIVIILVILMISLVTLKLFNDKKNTNNDTDNNTDNNMISDITISNISLSSIDYSYNDGYTDFELIAKNNNKNSVKINNYIVSIYENDNLINIYNFSNDVVLESNQEYNMGFTIDMEYLDKYQLKIELPELEVVNK